MVSTPLRSHQIDDRLTALVGSGLVLVCADSKDRPTQSNYPVIPIGGRGGPTAEELSGQPWQLNGHLAVGWVSVQEWHRCHFRWAR